MNQPYELYWLAFLLTGERQLSLDILIEALDPGEPTKPFFENWIVGWSRKLFIAKVLGAVNAEISASIHRTRLGHRERSTAIDGLPPDWSLDSDTGKLQLEWALLAIDIFPRCALLLMVFERLSLDDTAILLNAEKELVKTAKEIGLIELARNMARESRWTPESSAPEISLGLLQELTI